MAFNLKWTDFTGPTHSINVTGVGHSNPKSNSRPELRSENQLREESHLSAEVESPSTRPNSKNQLGKVDGQEPIKSIRLSVTSPVIEVTVAEIAS